MGRRRRIGAETPAEAPGTAEEPVSATELSPSIRELLLQFTETDERSTFDRAAFSRTPLQAR
jgi:hypothetical protein